MTEALNSNEVLDRVEAQLCADGDWELAAKTALVREYLGKLVVAQTEIMQTTDALVEDAEGLLGPADTGKQDAGSPRVGCGNRRCSMGCRAATDPATG